MSRSLIAVMVVAAGAVAACGGGGGSPSSAAANQAAARSTVESATVGNHGRVLVAGSNSMTLYQFAMDTSGSGTSACTSACISTWPPLTVPAGTTPTLASGISGQLSTITRSDGKGVQVTFAGKPLYFYSGDSKPGDSNGNYPEWSVVAVGTSGAASTSSGGGSYGGGGGYSYP